VIVVSSLYFDFQKTKLKKRHANLDVDEIKAQINHLRSENQDLRERLKYVEELLASPNNKINLAYEKEQIELDRQFKFDKDYEF
jgi:hypothetical protein